MAACNRGMQSRDAVRQGLIDHLARVGLNVKAMDITLSSLQFNGNQADATVSITPKGASPEQGMSMKYHLEQQGDHWVVTGRQESGGRPHSGAMPSGADPHASGETGPGSTAMPMPSPEDLPPVGKK